MADVFYPIQQFGGTELVSYAVRDFRGVEALATDPTDRAGFNEEALFTERADKAINNEHAADGSHDTLKLARAILGLRYDPVAVDYTLDPESTHGGVRHGTTSIATVSRISQGIVKITLATAMPSAYITGGGLTAQESGSNPFGAWVDNATPPTTTIVYARIYYGTTSSPASLVLADSDVWLDLWSN